MAFVFFATVLLLSGAAGFRKTKPTSQHIRARHAPEGATLIQTSSHIDYSKLGKVAALYTYGAPRSACPGLVKSPTDPCFPGYRMWAGRTVLGYNATADQIPMLPAPLSYKHPMMDVYEFDVSKTPNKAIRMPCSSASQSTPWYRVGDMTMHLRTPYLETAKTISPLLTNISEFSLWTSYYSDPVYVGKRVQAFGWNLVGYAFHPGQAVGGPQVQYLIQHATTLECIMTFQGTNSFQDILQDAKSTKAAFCGLVQSGETCGLFEECKPKRAGDSFVHKGFRDHLMNMMKSSLWQNNIRAKLGQCSKVLIGGHSLGGAMGELFTACNYRAPQPGAFGYDDFQWMHWTKGTPQKLPAI